MYIGLLLIKTKPLPKNRNDNSNHNTGHYYFTHHKQSYYLTTVFLTTKSTPLLPTVCKLFPRTRGSDTSGIYLT